MYTLPLHDATITDKNDQRCRPSNLYTEPEKFNEVNCFTDRGIGIFVADVKHVRDVNGQPLILNVPRLNFDLPPGEDVIVAALHYLTSEEAKGLKTLYCSMAKRGDGTTLRCNTYEWFRVGVGDDVYNKCAHLDIIPFAFPYDTLPTDLVSVADYELIMNSWFTNVINPIMNHPRCSIAFLSKATAEVYAKHSPIGSMKKLKADFKKNPHAYISASNDEMVAGYHPECCSKKKFRSNMEKKLSTNDALYTAIIHQVTGDLNRVCTYNMDYFDENSATFKLCERFHLEGCSRGGMTTGDRVTQAFALHNAKMFHLMSDAHWHIYDCRMHTIDSWVQALITKKVNEALSKLNSVQQVPPSPKKRRRLDDLEAVVGIEQGDVQYSAEEDDFNDIINELYQKKTSSSTSSEDDESLCSEDDESMCSKDNEAAEFQVQTQYKDVQDGISMEHKYAVGTKMKKRFHLDSNGRRTKVFEGVVVTLKRVPLYKVWYEEDNDAEELLEEELVRLITTPVYLK